ncbi:mannosyl-3-phosphoglycerate phosphatase [Erwinia typographi]|uniref:Mannosyl-3-phosphoglycerate phosphatase n=1 Tax=Erwinia typographi TaxID=371042 RepID=A0A0A4ADW1_9GAMM|nr:mannosyl-3-phosphoglycerate phosphatase-related protein [Erwinia typographi]KGT96033.1 mannosyl-3-phosphoglycerate phosphatase [Erwinia typographi]
MPGLNDPLMIVTDLDGSLLDHHTYDWEPARTWLERLSERKIPVVICSSKTAAEILPLQRQLGLSGAPYIAENGAIVQWSGSHEAALLPRSKSYSDICQTLQKLRERYRFKFTGFADVSEKEVAEWTGLTPHDAALAKMREGSESLIWRDTAEQFIAFEQALSAEQLSLVQGGRFWSVMNQGAGKGAALAFLLQHFRHPLGHRWVTIGLGDGPNDAPMLDEVDFAVIIKGYSKTPVTLQRADTQHFFRSARFGPEGWSEGLTHFIHQD